MYKIASALLFMALAVMAGCTSEANKAASFQQHAAGSSYAAALSRDGKWALVSSTDHGLAWWDIDNNALKYQWSHEQSGDNLVLAAAIADDNSVALTADRENFALWDTETGENQGFWKVRESNIRDIAVSNQGKHILIGKSNGVVVHITLETGRRLEFLGHTEKINSVAMSPNGRYALTGGNDYLAYLWDTQSGQVVHRFVHPSRVSKVALDVQGRYAFTADSQKQANIWRVGNGEKVSQLQYPSRQAVFSSVQFNPEGTLLATGSPTRKLVVWDLASGKALMSRLVTPKTNSRPQSAVVHAVTFGENDTVLSESSSGLLEFWPFQPST